MSTLRPVHTEHSVLEVAFVLHFSRPFSEDAISNITQLRETLQNELPKLDKIIGLGVRFQAGGQDPFGTPPEQKLVGVSFKHFVDNGAFDWNLRVEDQMAAVNCLAYTRWSETWEQAKRYLDLVSRLLIAPENPVVSISLEYVDRFLFGGAQEDFPFVEIFKTDSLFLTAHTRNSGGLWHVNQGWFENDVPEAKRALNILNITAGHSEGEHQTTVHHNCTMQFGKPLTSHKMLFANDESGQQKVERIFTWLHSKNKEILNALLSDDMLVRIGLNN